MSSRYARRLSRASGFGSSHQYLALFTRLKAAEFTRENPFSIESMMLMPVSSLPDAPLEGGGDYSARTGRTRTAPLSVSEDGTVDALRYGSSSCASSNRSRSPRLKRQPLPWRANTAV